MNASSTPLQHERQRTTVGSLRTHPARGGGMRRGDVWNTAEGKREPQNIWRNIKAGLEGLQPLEIPQNHQSFLWKSLDKNSLDLESLEKCKACRRCFATSEPVSDGSLVR